MRQDWEPEDLIEVWTLLEDDMKRVRNKSGATRLGFALLLKFFEVEARFPESAREMPAAAVEYVAHQVKVPAGAWADYDWQGDRIKRHRKEIREAYGFRANTEEDQERLAEWLAKNPRVQFHFTPVGSSWINQIETWFGIITRQSIRRGTFTTVNVLINQIRDYLAHWNTNPKPFTWTANADEILAKVKLVQTNIKKLVDNNAK